MCNVFVTRYRICIMVEVDLHRYDYTWLEDVSKQTSNRCFSRIHVTLLFHIKRPNWGAHSRTTYRGISLARVLSSSCIPPFLFSLTRSRCTLAPTLLETLLILSWRYPGVCGWMRAANWLAVNPLQRCVCRSAFPPYPPVTCTVS